MNNCNWFCWKNLKVQGVTKISQTYDVRYEEIQGNGGTQLPLKKTTHRYSSRHLFVQRKPANFQQDGFKLKSILQSLTHILEKCK